MRGRRIVVLPKAEADAEGIADYIAEDSAEQAARFLRSVRETYATLSEAPGMGAPRAWRDRRLHGLRSFPVQGFPNHLVFYRELRDGVEIVRVLHGARDIPRTLRET